MDPAAECGRTGGRKPCPRCGSTSRVCEKTALKLICAPKGVGPLPGRTFLLQNGTFCECRDGGHGAPIMDPRSCRRLRLCASWAWRSCPVVAVLAGVETLGARSSRLSLQGRTSD